MHKGTITQHHHQAEAGFTLIELLVVLAVLAMVTATVPAVTAGLPGVRLRAEADKLAALCRELHQVALARGAPTELSLDPASRSFATSLDRVPTALPGTVEAMEVRVGMALALDRVSSIRFFSDGSASDASVVLRSGARRESITIDWLTGKVRRGG